MKAPETTKHTLTRIGTGIGFLAALAGLVGSLVVLVDWRIASKLQDPTMVEALSDEIRRPSLIFDSGNRVLDDQGAMMAYLSLPPRFEDAPEDSPLVVVVAPTVHVASPPLLQVLDAYAFIAEREEEFQ